MEAGEQPYIAAVLPVAIVPVTVIGGRVLVPITSENFTPAAAPGTLLYTVTAGKRLNITHVAFTIINTSATVGRVAINDNTALKVPYLIADKSGSTNGYATFDTDYIVQPLVFLTSVRLAALAGTITASILLTGYEELL